MTVGPGYPADNPNVLGIGGNQTNPSRSEPLTNPVVWNDSCSNAQCAGGGGVSAIYGIPSYQQGLAGALSQTHRNEPDFSMPAMDVAAYYTGSGTPAWHTLAGTSWSAPEAAALLAELYQYCGANGGPIAGVTNPATIPYYVHSQSAAAFIDVTSGDNQFNGTTPFQTAGTGYDNASGLGVPHGYAFAQTACPGRTPAGGLSVHTGTAMSVGPQTVRPAGDLTLDVTPRIQGLLDKGVRASTARTDIQIAIDPSSNVAQSEAAVVSALQNAGFTITQRFLNHLVVDAQAPSAAVGRFFRTQLHDVLQARYGTRYMPATQIVVPAAIAPYVAGVSLDDVVKLHVPRR